MSNDHVISSATIHAQDIVSSEPIKQPSCEFEYLKPDLCYARIIVPHQILDALYDEAARSQQASTQTYGFQHGAVPLEYIKKNFKENFIEHLREFVFQYFVINFLYEQIRIKKLLIVGDPRIQSMEVDPQHDASFTFELSVFPDLTIYDWKYFPFRAPKRKNYKDLDRQVESFIQDEMERAKHFTADSINMGDWVHFTVEIVDPEENPLTALAPQQFIFKLHEDETESQLRSIFIGKKCGESFLSNHHSLQAYFSDTINSNYMFKVTVFNIIPGNYVCFEQFKKTFRIKTNKDMHKKLIEVFSYRNDLSQRHTTVEESLNTLLSRHRFTIPNYLILRQQKILLASMQTNPDYHVYKAQKNFQDHVRKLAQKQCMELIFIDKLAYHENISVSEEDIKGYLNLLNRPRVKDFVYFELPAYKIQGQDVPITIEEVKRTCLREKTVNYIIYQLTKQ